MTDRRPQLVQPKTQHAAGVPATDIDLPAAAGYVAGRQGPSGGFCFYRNWGVDEPSAADGFHAVGALSLLGAAPRDRPGAIRWFRDLQDQRGGYRDVAVAWYASEALARLHARPRRACRHWLWQQADLLFATPAPGRHPDAILLETARYLELCRHFELALESRHREAAARILHVLQDPSGPFPRGAPTLVAGAAAVRVATAAALMPDRRVLDHARACEDPVYGFRTLPCGRSTQLEALAAGCAVLARFGTAPRYPAGVHGTVAACQGRSGGFGRQPGAIPTLRATWLALTILQSLEEATMSSPSESSLRFQANWSP